MKIATKFIMSLLASTGLGFAGELLPIGAFQEFIVTDAPARFTNILEQQDGSYVAYTGDVGAKVYWSADAKVWSLQQTLAGSTLAAMSTGGGQTMVVGNQGAASVSSDGKIWTAVNADVTVQFVAVAYQNGAFYALSSLRNANAELWRWAGTDGWAKVSTLPGTAKLLVTGLGHWFAWAGDGVNTTLHVSADGVTWTAQTFESAVKDVDAGDGRLLLSTQSQSYFSGDGNQWEAAPFIVGSSVTFSGGRFVSRGLATGQKGEPTQSLSYFSFGVTEVYAPSRTGLVAVGYGSQGNSRVALSRPVTTRPKINTETPVDSFTSPLSAGWFSFSVESEGGQLEFQWYEGGRGDTSRPIHGATGASFGGGPLGSASDPRFWCRVSNSLGHADSKTVRVIGKTEAMGSLVYEVTPRTQEDMVTIGSTTNWNEYGLVSSIRWTRNGSAVPAGKSYQLIRVGPTFDDGGYYQANVFYDGWTYTSDPVPVGVVRRTVTIGGLTGEGKSIRLRQMAAGPELTYLWRREGVDLVDEPGHIDGATSSSLTITNVRPEDEGWYTCHVSNGSIDLVTTLPVTLEGMVYYLTVEPIPVIESIEAPAEGMVARSMRIQPQSRQVVLRYEVRGLPAGMTFDSKSGAIAGAPLASGIHRIGIRAINSAGASPWQTITITVAPMPDHLTGSFAGLMGRIVSTGEGLGGACSIKVSKTGAVTGFVDIGSKRYPYTGRLDCTGSSPTCFTTKCAGGQVIVQFSYQSFSDSMVGSAGALDGSWSTPLLAKKVGLSSQTAAWLGKRYVDLTPLTVSGDRPQGSGTGTISIGSKANFSWVGKLADGSAYSCAGYLTPDGHFAARTLLYGGKGSLQGWQHVDATKDKPYGTLEWMKNPVPNAKSFPQGFARHSLSVTPKL